MKQLELILLSAMWVFPGIAFIMGKILLRKKSALYLRMIVDGVGCISLGRLFVFAKCLTEGAYPQGFHIGILGMIGVFAFFFNANYGQINTLCDDGSKRFLKYRLFPLILPVLVLASNIIMFLQTESIETRVVYAVLSVCASLSGYYHLKLLIFPDVPYSVGKCLRPFNLLALIYSLLTVFEILLYEFSSPLLITIVYIVSTVISALLIPVTARGLKKWTT